MNEIKSQDHVSALHQIGALLISLIVFVSIWFLAGVLLAGLDHIRGSDDGLLQSAFRDVFAPGLGGFWGISAGVSLLKRSTPKFVFLGFSVIVLLLMGAYLGIVGVTRMQAGLSVGSYLWGAVTLAAGLLGAYKGARDEGFGL